MNFLSQFLNQGGGQSSPQTIPSGHGGDEKGSWSGHGQITPMQEHPLATLLFMGSGLIPYDEGKLSDIFSGGGYVSMPPQQAPMPQSNGISPFMMGGGVPFQQSQQPVASFSPSTSPLQNLGMMSQASAGAPSAGTPFGGAPNSFQTGGNPFGQLISQGGLFNG